MRQQPNEAGKQRGQWATYGQRCSFTLLQWNMCVSYVKAQ